MPRFMLSACFIAASALAGPHALAEEAKLEGTFFDWAVYTKGDGGAKVCYALATPEDVSPTSVNHGKVYFMVASWANGAASEQPSLMTGYPFKVTAPPSARIGSSKVPMYVSQNEAFVESDDAESKLVRDMRRGAVMRIAAVSQRGTATSYEFSLKGITAALKKAKGLCG